MTHEEFYKPTKPHTYIATVALLAAAFAMPVTSGGWHDLSSLAIWAYAWFATVIFTLAIFTSPLDSLHKSPKPISFLFAALSWASVAWLAYHGEVLLPSLMVYSFFMAHIFQERSKDRYLDE